MAVMNHHAFSIGELARRSGVSPHTLRYYEAAGILKPAVRSASGHRQYQDDDLRWLEFVLRLKMTGMPLADIKRYAALRDQGETTLHARLAMLEVHRQRLVARIDALGVCAGALDDKIRIYRELIAASAAPAKEGKP